MTYGILFPDQRWKLDPLHWELRVFPTGPPGESLAVQFLTSLLVMPLTVSSSGKLFLVLPVMVQHGSLPSVHHTTLPESSL